MGNAVKKSSQQMGPSIVASTPLKHTKLSISQNIAELSSKRVFMDFKIGNHVPVRVNMYLYDKVINAYLPFFIFYRWYQRLLKTFDSCALVKLVINTRHVIHIHMKLITMFRVDIKLT